MDFIDRLRKKTPRAKKRIAFAASAVVTLAIFGIWASVLHFNIDSKSADITAAAANGSSTDVDPLSAFWDVISTGWNGLSNNINQIKTGVNDAKGLIDTLSTATSSNLAGATSSQSESTVSVPASPSSKDVFILDNIKQ